MTLMPDLQRDLIDAAARGRASRRRVRSALGVALAALAAAVLTVAVTDGPETHRDARPGGEPTPPTGPPPRPGQRAVAVPGTLSERVAFRFAGVRYEMVAYRSRRNTLCIRLTARPPVRPADPRPSMTCAGGLFLRRQLEATRVLNVGGGGARHLEVAGFAIGGVRRVAVTGTEQPSRVVLTRPWRPGGLEPVRAFVAVVAPPPGGDRASRRALRAIRVVEAP